MKESIRFEILVALYRRVGGWYGMRLGEDVDRHSHGRLGNRERDLDARPPPQSEAVPLFGSRHPDCRVRRHGGDKCTDA
jgi:hypothetical protein